MKSNFGYRRVGGGGLFLVEIESNYLESRNRIDCFLHQSRRIILSVTSVCGL